ncbi:MAG: two component transcriptional regulator, winged helix family [Bacteroidetes bacterium]|nr:two component transcriptional regulator, winged helix family [Bacteroidota bacterium]
MEKQNILIVDDEEIIRKVLGICLKGNNYNVITAANAKEAKSIALLYPPELIILDLGLPDDDGQNLLIELKKWFLGAVIILSVKNNEEEIIKAIDNGACDYITKPFRTGELLARIRTALKSDFKENNLPKLKFNNLEIDIENHFVSLSGKRVKLTATEFELLSLLARNEGRVLTHQFILKQIWGVNYSNQLQYLRVYIGFLRRKIETDQFHPQFIVTEPGIGYRFNPIT